MIVLTAEPQRPRTMPTTILAVLEEWRCTWMSNSLRLISDDHWLEDAIEAGTCVAVTDGSYIRDLIPNVCSVAFVLECSEGRGQITGSFPEQSNNANIYRAELLGLMAVYLILLSTNRVRPNLTGAVSVGRIAWKHWETCPRCKKTGYPVGVDTLTFLRTAW